MRRRPTRLFAALLLTLSAGPAFSAGPLDGRTYDVTYARRGTKTKVGPSQLVFADGTFRSSAHDALGFPASPYTAGLDGARTTFTCEVKSAKQGVLSWKGTVDGDAISGDMTWNRVRRTPIRFWFKGRLK